MEEEGIDAGGGLYNPTFPAHWRRSKLYPLARWTNGLAFRESHFTPSGRPVIKIAEIKAGIGKQTKRTDGVFDDLFHVRQNDMLFS